MTRPYVTGSICRRLPFVFMAVISVILAILSVTEDASLYSSWWMTLLWVLTAGSGCLWLVASGYLHSLPVVLVHSALLLILAGAAVTHFTSLHGSMHLRAGIPEHNFIDDNGKTANIPFEASLIGIEVETYPGTSTPMDFRATVRLDKEAQESISLNHIMSHKGYRLVLSTYDDDMQGATFSVTRDSAGTAISFAGYLLFAVAAAVCLGSPSGTFRTTLRRLRSLPLVLLMSFIATPTAGATDITNETNDLPTLPSVTSRHLSRLPVFYNGRVAPFGTLEREFTSTVTGSTSWKGYSASQVAEGFMFYFGSWKTAPVIKVESGMIREALGLDEGERASYTRWFDAVARGRVSTDSIATCGDTKSRVDLARFECINSLVSGAMLRFFPLRDKNGHVDWYAPADNNIPLDTDTSLWIFIRKSPGYLNECIITRNYTEADKVIGKIALYQKKESPESIPSGFRIEAELFYNHVARPFIPAGVGLVVGIVMFVLSLRRRTAGRIFPLATVGSLWMWVTILSTLRWIVTGNVPLASGFETMQFMAWCSLTLAVVMAWKRSIATSFAIIAGSLALLVAAMGARGAMVAPLMPILSSPLLSLHVVMVMGAYSLMAIMALAGLMGLLSKDQRSRRIACMERAMLYPALFLMGTGIFIGAVWANMSWGRYWGWDPKEVWALITLLTYSFAAHPRSLPSFNKPKMMHIFCIAAFLTVLFTYFGVNYLLRGLHSYA